MCFRSIGRFITNIKVGPVFGSGWLAGKSLATHDGGVRGYTDIEYGYKSLPHTVYHLFEWFWATWMCSSALTRLLEESTKSRQIYGSISVWRHRHKKWLLKLEMASKRPNLIIHISTCAWGTIKLNLGLHCSRGNFLNLSHNFHCKNFSVETKYMIFFNH